VSSYGKTLKTNPYQQNPKVLLRNQLNLKRESFNYLFSSDIKSAIKSTANKNSYLKPVASLAPE